MLGTPGGKILDIARLCCRIEADDRLTGQHPFCDEILVSRHFHRLIGNLVGQFGRNDDHRFIVAYHDIAGPHRHIAAADRHIDVERLMQRQIGRRRRPVVIGGSVRLVGADGRL